ncbi:MAG: L,D-transpeptidase family protein [Campylobacterota bacterium]|nr:L,D-transpeptidase family protein [Campylobacterota bacterium]
MKSFILLSIIYTNLLFSSQIDMIELYRTQGINAVEKILSQQLQTQEYWDSNLKYKDVSNGYYESIRYVMICQKNLKDIVLYDTKDKQKIFSSNVFVGKSNGDKQKEGDMKTPLGAYDITKRITKVDSFYGPLALTTNYPNIYDKSQGKTGSGIWIHGLPQSGNRDDFTKGCIALDNTKIKKLDNSINIDNSVLVISETKLQMVSKKDISIVMSNIFSWKSAWINSDLKNYLNFYDSNFKRSNGQDLVKFTKHKKRVFNRKEKKTIKFSNINIIPYPNAENKKIFKVVMDEYYKTKNYKFDGKKELYIEILNDKFKILTES